VLIYLVLYAALPSHSRITHELERTLRRAATIPRTKHNKSKVEEHKLKIQEIFDALNAPNAPLPAESCGSAKTSKSESSVSSALPSPILGGVLIILTSPTSLFQPAGAWSDVPSHWMNSPP